MRQVHIAHVVQMVEHERGWGSKPDGRIAFHSAEAAKEHIREATKGYTGEAPDYYVSYQYVGEQVIPDSVAQKMYSSRLVHFD